jgi:hypothetical protein
MASAGGFVYVFAFSFDAREQSFMLLGGERALFHFDE